MYVKVSFKLNGEDVTVDVEPNEILLDTLRLKLGIKSVKRGCERAECGACTVLLNGSPVYSCTLLTVQIDGKEVRTLEGIQDTPEVKTLVSKFVEAGAVQCGFCTPGFIVTAYAMIKKGVEPTSENIKKALEGNICRCTGYKKIIDAVTKAIESVK